MATNHGRACFSTRRPHAPSTHATGMAAIRRCAAAAVQRDNRNNRLSACSWIFTTTYFQKVTFSLLKQINVNVRRESLRNFIGVAAIISLSWCSSSPLSSLKYFRYWGLI